MEQPLPKHGACCLASINLSEFVVDPYTDHSYFDSKSFINAVKVGIRTLDKLIDENYSRHPLKKQQEMSFNYRNIGLGVFGYGTMLMKCGFRYGAEDALMFTDSLFSLMFVTAVLESNRLAKELGPYPKYKQCVFDSDIMKAHFPPDELDEMKKTGLRNCSLLSIAPTGTLSNLLGETGGCEPEFTLKYTRRTVGMTEGEDSYYEVDCKAAREYKRINDTDELPDYFVASDDIPWMDRIRTQAVMQNHIDTGISSTINLPNETTVEEVEDLYIEAWKHGLKGVTIFRKGCKRMPILSKEDSEVKKVGKMRKLTTGCGSLHLNAMFNSKTGDLVEIFLNKGSSGGCNNFMIGLSRQISLNCKNGSKFEDILDQLASSGVCPSYAVRTATKHDTSPGSSCPVAVGKALKEMWEEMQNDIRGRKSKENTTALVEKTGKSRTNSTKRDSGENNRKVSSKTSNGYDGITCPVCHSPIEHIGGCDQCNNCGWSKCE